VIVCSDLFRLCSLCVIMVSFLCCFLCVFSCRSLFVIWSSRSSSVLSWWSAIFLCFMESMLAVVLVLYCEVDQRAECVDRDVDG